MTRRAGAGRRKLIAAVATPAGVSGRELIAGAATPAGVSRRELIAGAATLAGAASLALPVSAPAADADPQIVFDLIAREEAAAVAYPLASPFSRHERDHALALRAHLAGFGRSAPPPPRDLPPLGSAALITLERELLDAYDDALARLVNPAILKTAATIAASHAQHHALLARRSGLDPLG